MPKAQNYMISRVCGNRYFFRPNNLDCCMVQKCILQHSLMSSKLVNRENEPNTTYTFTVYPNENSEARRRNIFDIHVIGFAFFVVVGCLQCRSVVHYQKYLYFCAV